MALAPRLELRQGQSLVLTPQLQQAIKLLQLSNMELSAYVENELERNPLLEKVDEDETANQRGIEGDGDDSAAAKTGNEAGDAELKFTETDNSSAAEDILDTDFENVYSDEARAETIERQSQPAPATSDWSTMKSSGSPGGSPSGEFSFESTLSQDVTLSDHLIEQLNMTFKEPAQRMIGLHLIDMVDEAGYLAGKLENVAARLGTSLDKVEVTLKEMQRFDPCGILARNLAECLALQLAEKDRLDPAMQALLDNIELLAKHDLINLKRLCGIDSEDLSDMIAEIRSLNPKPGLAFGSIVVHPVVPDVFVRQAPDGGWHVELNSGTLPKVLVNNVYYTKVSKTATDTDDKEYLSQCFADANWLVKSLDQRARTILKVSREIVRQQDGFFVHGVQHLRPLNLKIIADAISMHESTVSRVTSNKYMATPRGIFELKYFFTSAIASAEGGEAHSAEAVRHRIKALISDETVKSVLSDDKIVEVLRESGIDIARRTVAKYREAMKIPSSVQRRREKKARLSEEFSR